MGHFDHTTCSVLIDTKWFAISVQSVREAIRPVPVSTIPLVPPEILGLCHLRGHILPVVDPRLIFGLTPAGKSQDTKKSGFFLVIDSATAKLVLVVDKVSQVIARQPEEFLPTPKLKASGFNSFVEGAYSSAEGLVLKLNIERIVEHLRLQTLKSVSSRPGKRSELKFS